MRRRRVPLPTISISTSSGNPTPRVIGVKISVSGKFPPYTYHGNEQGIPEYGFKEE